MQSDIMLNYGEKTLIIDAKYYDKHVMQTQFSKSSVRSAHLYQIFTYVKNKEVELANQPHEVSGILLYAKTDEATLPNIEYQMSGNKIGVCTLDLNQDFPEIRRQLNEIVYKYLGVKHVKGSAI